VVVPLLFWWLSLAGSLIFLTYAVFYEKDSVFIFAYAFTWIPYIRNVIIHYRHERSQQICPECGVKAAPAAHFCAQCGVRLTPSSVAASSSH
jgi:ribosomal protein L40E